MILSALVVQSDAHLTGDQEIACSTSARSGNILSLRLVMNCFLLSLTPDARRAVCQFLAKECAFISTG